MEADDILFAMAIAIAVILTAFYFKFRLRGRDVQGFWGTADGKQYAITAAGGGRIEVEGPHLAAYGEIGPLRSICIGNGEQTVCGSVDLDGRWISWPGGVAWTRCGIIR